MQLAKPSSEGTYKTFKSKPITSPRGETCTSLGRNLQSIACSITGDVYYFSDFDSDFYKITSSPPCNIYDLQLGRKLLMKAGNNSIIELIVNSISC